MLRQRHQHAILPQNSGLLAGNLAQRVTEILCVVNPNIRNHAHHRLDRVGRIQPPAQPHLQHRQLHAVLREPAERNRRQQLEEAWIVRQFGPRNQPRRRGIHASKDAPKLRVGNLQQSAAPSRNSTRNLHPLIHPQQVRRRIQSRLQPRRVGNRRQRRRRRALAIGARNQHRRKALLRIAQRLQQRADMLQRKLPPHHDARGSNSRASHAQLRPQRRQPFQCIFIRHHVYQSRTSSDVASTDAATHIRATMLRSINPSVRPARYRAVSAALSRSSTTRMPSPSSSSASCCGVKKS